VRLLDAAQQGDPPMTVEQTGARASRSTRVLAICVVLLANGAGCAAANGGGDECQVGGDCASGACQDGRCVAASGGSAGAAGSSGAAGTSGAAGSSGTAGAAGQGGGAAGASGAGSGGSGGSAGAGGATCKPNNDGIIERSEVPLMAGLSAKFLTAEDAPIDTAGATQSDGSRVWDLTGSLPGDHLALVATQSVAGTWYASDFAGATYAAKLSDTQSLLGVFQATPSSLSLIGVVSPSGGTTRTQLSYAPAATVLSFPLQMGKTWQTTSNVTGVAQGVPSDYVEKYAYKVDAHGTLKTPYADFQVLRVGVVLTRTVGVLQTTVRTYLFVSECFGTVASIVSNDNESSAEFTTAAEVERLSP
jgi:hypothetical protein